MISANQNHYPAELDALLRPNGVLIPVPAAELSRFSPLRLAVFCLHHAIYQLPTTELIEWLADRIAGRKAIEIGAGNGATGRGALGIPMTDSYLQDGTNTFVKAYYDAMQQPRIQYPADVRKLTAKAAVVHYRPQVVIGCWVTHREVRKTAQTGNYWGVDEHDLMARGVEEYIHVGNAQIHGVKPLLGSTRHRVERTYAPWLYSRSQYHTDNVIYSFSPL